MLNPTIENERSAARRRNLTKMACATACATILAAGTVMAYLTSTDTKVNKFELADTGTLDAITVVEPNWDLTDTNDNGIPDAAEGFLPGQTITKDPQVDNASGIDAYVMVNVAVPTETVITGDATEAALTELFTYTVSADWIEQGSGVYDAESATTVHTYVYKDLLAAGATTPTVFDEVTLVDLINGQIADDALVKDLTVTSYAIQALGFDSATDAYPAMVNSITNA